MDWRQPDGKTEEGEGGGRSECRVTNEPSGLEGIGRESKGFRFSGASRIDPGDRPWTSPSGQTDSNSGGIGSRLIAKLIEQRAEVLSRYEIVMQRKTEYEAQMQRIDRELDEARALISEVLTSDVNDE